MSSARTLPLLDGLLVFVSVGAVRFSVRLLDLLHRRRRPGYPVMQPVVIAGAGEAGMIIVREIRSNPMIGMDLVGFLDDDPHKRAMRIQGVPVLGALEDLPMIVRDFPVQQVIIAMPTAPGKTIRRVVELCEEAKVNSRIIPGLADILDGGVSVSQLRKVEIEDLLRREPVLTDTGAVTEMLPASTCWSPAAAARSASELCRQVLRAHPAELMILGHGENSVFEISQELGAALKTSPNGQENPRHACAL